MLRRIHPVACSVKKYLSPVSRCFSSNRGMADHLDKTAECTRNEVLSLATVVGMRDESKTVKSLTLKIDDERFTFKAGQWVDMYIPGVETVGGFSMYSSPLHLQKDRTIDLAIKYSQHPPAQWIHTQCKEGDQVQVRVGGDFFFDPVRHKDNDLLLIAGGVGINPLLSIVNEVVDMNNGDDSNKFNGRVSLLYSASTREELLFKDRLKKIQRDNENIMCQFHVTKEGGMYGRLGNIYLLGGRIDKNVLYLCLNWLREDKTQAFICGPSHMIEDMETSLVNLKISKDSIHYEKWW